MAIPLSDGPGVVISVFKTNPRAIAANKTGVTGYPHIL